MAWEVGQEARKSRPLIAVCLPNKGRLTTEFVERTWIPIRFQKTEDFDIIWFLNKTYSITVARNSMVEDAIKAGADYIMWIDDDIIVENMEVLQAVRLLFHTGAEISSGLYRAKQVTGFNFCAWIKTGQVGESVSYAPVSKWTEGANWLSVDAVGHGFCLVKADVYNRMKGPWYVWNTKAENSEDFSFCRRAKEELGLEIKVATDIHLSHLGDLVIQFDGTARTPQI